MKRLTAIILAVLMVLTVAAGAMGEENRVWKMGDSGEKVTWIQTRLKELEYLDRDPDGVFDEETEKALREFQWDQGLMKTGMADSVTMKALETATVTKTELAARRLVEALFDVEYEEAATEAASYSGKFAVNAYATSMPSASRIRL